MKRRKPKQKSPNPGSEEARKLGCTCPIMDNNYGKGYMLKGDMFWIAVDCPVHGSNIPGQSVHII